MPNRRVHDGREAPKLMVKYQCPKCFTVITLDAYDGPPSCAGSDLERHVKMFLVPLAVEHGDEHPNPLADIEAMRSTPRAFV